MIVVIGSGPAGVACASALVEKGLDVTLVDAGIQLEPERKSVVDGLARVSSEDWPADAVETIRGEMAVEMGGVPLKHVYGSDYPYQEVDRLVPFENHNAATRPTLARGGFSTVWGASVLPYLAGDIDDWPIGVEDLAPHYRAACSLVPISAVEDDLASLLPLYTNGHQQLDPSVQISALLEDLARSEARLKAGGFRFGRARVAVRAEADERGRGCAYCGLCLRGCPYRLIYEASSTLDQLRRSERFRYVPDLVVERLVESGGSVTLHARSCRTGEPVRLEASRVYVGCGVVSTTKLLLHSLEAFDRPLVMKDSTYFLVPWLRWKAAPRVQEEALYTLAQAFIELTDPTVSAKTIHLQVYAYNDLYRQLLARPLGRASGLFRVPIDQLLSRMLLIQGYLHSDLSPTLTATLRRHGEGSKLVLEGGSDPATRRTLRRVMLRLIRHVRDFRALPAWPVLQVAAPGRGFHCGGTFPMRESPGPFESDRLGRPHGFERVHVVDASVFPSMPATTITLSVMANAHRIASACDEA